MTPPLRFPHAGYAWRTLRNQGHLLQLALGLLFAALMVGLALKFLPSSGTFWLGLVSGIAALLLWHFQVDGLLQQNRPMLARLVPGHVTALRRSLLRQWLLHTGVWTVWLCTFFPSTGAPLMAAGFGAALVALAWAARQPWLWLAYALGFVALMVQWGSQAPALQAAFSSQQPMAGWPWAAFVLLASGAALPGLLSTGHAAHRRNAAQRENMRLMSAAMMQGGGMPVRLRSGWLEALERLVDWPWRRLLARELNGGSWPAATKQPGRVGRLNLVLAGSSHWARQAGLLAWLVLLFGLPFWAMETWRQPNPSNGTRAINLMCISLCYVAFGVALSPVVRIGAHLRQMRREFDLLRLAPGVPPMPVLGRRWSGHLAAQFLLGWTLATALVVLPMLAWGSADAVRFSAGFAAGCLLLLPLAWVHGATLTGESRWSPQVTNMSSIVMGSVVGGVCQGLEVAPLHSLGGFALLTSGLALAVALRTGRAANPKASGH